MKWKFFSLGLRRSCSLALISFSEFSQVLYCDSRLLILVLRELNSLLHELNLVCNSLIWTSFVGVCCCKGILSCR